MITRVLSRFQSHTIIIPTRSRYLHLTKQTRFYNNLNQNLTIRAPERSNNVMDRKHILVKNNLVSLKKIRVDIKERLIKTYVYSVATIGCEINDTVKKKKIFEALKTWRCKRREKTI